MLRQCPLAIAQRLVHRTIAVSTAVLGQSHKDNVCCTAVEEQPKVKEVQLSQPSSTSLLMISSGLRVQLHLPPLDLAWNPVVCDTTVTLKIHWIHEEVVLKTVVMNTTVILKIHQPWS